MLPHELLPPDLTNLQLEGPEEVLVHLHAEGGGPGTRPSAEADAGGGTTRNRQR